MNYIPCPLITCKSATGRCLVAAGWNLKFLISRGVQTIRLDLCGRRPKVAGFFARGLTTLPLMEGCHIFAGSRGVQRSANQHSFVIAGRSSRPGRKRVSPGPRAEFPQNLDRDDTLQSIRQEGQYKGRVTVIKGGKGTDL